MPASAFWGAQYPPHLKWHRRLPTSCPHSPLSSLKLCPSPSMGPKTLVTSRVLRRAQARLAGPRAVRGQGVGAELSPALLCCLTSRPPARLAHSLCKRRGSSHLEDSGHHMCGHLPVLGRRTRKRGQDRMCWSVPGTLGWFLFWLQLVWPRWPRAAFHGWRKRPPASLGAPEAGSSWASVRHTRICLLRSLPPHGPLVPNTVLVSGVRPGTVCWPGTGTLLHSPGRREMGKAGTSLRLCVQPLPAPSAPCDPVPVTCVPSP